MYEIIGICLLMMGSNYGPGPLPPYKIVKASSYDRYTYLHLEVDTEAEQKDGDCSILVNPDDKDEKGEYSKFYLRFKNTLNKKETP